VHGIALHLVGGSLNVISWLRDGFRGTPAPEGVGEAGFIGWLDDLQAGWVEAARRISPRLVVELLDWSRAGYDDALGSHDPSSVIAHVSWASDAPVPLWLDHARELTEKWIHRQQLLEALGRPSDLRADLGRPVLDALRWAYPYRLRDHVRPPGALVVIDAGDEHDSRLGCHWRLVSDGVQWSFDGDARGIEVARITTTAEQLWRLLSNNRVDRDAIMATGDPQLLDALLRVRAIIGSPR
jgi:hypothetical protein